MLGSVIVAVITVSLLLTGVYLGNSGNRDANDMAEEDVYSEGFFGSLDSLVGGLEESASRGVETREDRYQEYLKVQQMSESANTRFQGTVKTYQAQPTPTPTTEAKTTTQTETSFIPAIPKETINTDLDTLGEDDDTQQDALDDNESQQSSGGSLFDFSGLEDFDDSDDLDS